MKKNIGPMSYLHLLILMLIRNSLIVFTMLQFVDIHDLNKVIL